MKIETRVAATTLALAMTCAGLLTACGKNQDTQALVSEARTYQQKGEFKAAIIQLKNAVQKSPEDREVRRLLGQIYYQSNDPLSAEKELRKAIELGAAPADVLPTLGRVLLALGQFQKVLDEVKLNAGEKPDALVLAVRGEAFLGLGKFDEARESFSAALKASPDNSDAAIGLAKLSVADGELDEAAAYADQAIAKNASSVDAWMFKGDLLRLRRKPDDALEAYKKAIELKPALVGSYLARAHIHINAGKFNLAKAEVDAARKQDAQSLHITYTQALLDFSQGKHAAAQESILQVLRVSPDHMPSVLLAGAIQYALGSTQQAEQHLKRYLERNPGHPYASKLLVATLLKNGDTPRALKLLTPMLKDAEKDPQLLTLAGEVYMHARDFSKAIDYLEKASALAPDAAIIRTALGLSRLAKGEDARGIAELEMATNMDAKPAQAATLLVMTHLRNKEFDKAIATVNKLEKDEATNPILQNLKGAAYLGKKDAAAARNSFQKALSLQPDFFPAAISLARLDIFENKPDAAKKRLEDFLKVDKKNAQAMTKLAELAMSQGRKEEATSWLERASNENPDDVKQAVMLAAHYLQQGDKQKAFSLAQKLQTANPNSPEALDVLAQAQFANNDLPGSLQSYKKLAILKPDAPSVQVRIAAVLMAMQNQNAAADALKTALAAKPDHFEAQMALANIEIRRGNYDQAIKLAKQIQKTSPKAAQGYILEGDVLMVQKKPDLAFKAYEQGFAHRPTGLLAVRMHQALALSGRGRDGVARLNQWLKDYPTDLATRLYLASAYATDQQHTQAVEQYQSVLQADPKNVVALNNLALVYQEQKDVRALEYAEKAVGVAPENPAVLDTLGWLLVEQGNLTRGLQLLQKATTLAPGVPSVRFHLAQALVKLGDKAKARQELEQLLAAGKTFEQADAARSLLKQLN